MRAAVARPDVDAVVVVYVPPVATAGTGARGGVAGGGGRVGNPGGDARSWRWTDYRSTWRCRDRTARRPRVGAVLPHPGARGRRARARRPVRRLAGPTGRGRCPRSAGVDRSGATCTRSTCCATPTRATGPSPMTNSSALLGCYGIELARVPVRRVAPTPRWRLRPTSAIPVALKASDESPAAPVGPGRCAGGAQHRGAGGGRLRRAERASPGPAVYVQEMAPPEQQRGMPPSSGSARTRRSGRSCRSGSAAWPPNCSTTGPTGRCR